MDRRLSRRQRIRSERSFQTIFRNARFVRGKSLNLWFCRKTENDEAPETAAVGIMVSKKVSPSAVKRNRIRRKIREAFRLGQDRMPKASFLLIQARQLMEKSGPEEILAELLGLLEKAEK